MITAIHAGSYDPTGGWGRRLSPGRRLRNEPRWVEAGSRRCGVARSGVCAAERLGGRSHAGAWERGKLVHGSIGDAGRVGREGAAERLAGRSHAGAWERGKLVHGSIGDAGRVGREGAAERLGGRSHAGAWERGKLASASAGAGVGGFCETNPFGAAFFLADGL